MTKEDLLSNGWEEIATGIFRFGEISISFYPRLDRWILEGDEEGILGRLGFLPDCDYSRVANVVKEYYDIKLDHVNFEKEQIEKCLETIKTWIA